jgi:hypothetical protein
VINWKLTLPDCAVSAVDAVVESWAVDAVVESWVDSGRLDGGRLDDGWWTEAGVWTATGAGRWRAAGQGCSERVGGGAAVGEGGRRPGGLSLYRGRGVAESWRP